MKRAALIVYEAAVRALIFVGLRFRSGARGHDRRQPMSDFEALPEEIAAQRGDVAELNALQDWAWADVKAALERAGKSIASVARDNGLHRSTLAGLKSRPCHRNQLLIARALNKKPEAIWPSRYVGNPKKARRK